MPTLKKVRLAVDENSVNEREALVNEREAREAREAIDALTILDIGLKIFFKADQITLNNKMKEFQNTYHYSHLDTLNRIRLRHPYIDKAILTSSPKNVYVDYVNRVNRFDKKPVNTDKEPVKTDKEPVKTLVNGEYQWVFKGYAYEVKGHYSDEQIRLLILEDFDKERRYFEKLKAKFDETQNEESSYQRPRIPENVRVEVWRRDGGKCARCGSREKLEYDHIVPISKGGSNTARNIELLCEKHNRSKSDNVV